MALIIWAREKMKIPILTEISFSFDFLESFASFNHVIETNIFANLQQHVNILLIFKMVEELDYVFMLHGFMDLDLTLELLLSPGFD